MRRTRPPTSSSRAGRSGAAPAGAPASGAVGERALERLTPVLSGFAGTEGDLAVGRGAAARPRRAAFRVSNPDPIAAGAPRGGPRGDRATSASPAIERGGRRAREPTSSTSPTSSRSPSSSLARRAASARASSCSSRRPTRSPLLAASLLNHGVTVTMRDGRVRLSVHAAHERRDRSTCCARVRRTRTAASSDARAHRRS